MIFGLTADLTRPSRQSFNLQSASKPTTKGQLVWPEARPEEEKREKRKKEKKELERGKTLKTTFMFT
jgi:hypothetical protein